MTKMYIDKIDLYFPSGNRNPLCERIAFVSYVSRHLVNKACMLDIYKYNAEFRFCKVKITNGIKKPESSYSLLKGKVALPLEEKLRGFQDKIRKNEIKAGHSYDIEKLLDLNKLVFPEVEIVKF